ncbi:TOMM precursor leader peptide-binding protein [Kitasatospora sp. MAP5-34]|uniref:TOMM precursor leader peptide-binding protein n=1 Tax=Kitasatospora sp. MAP5-34 TaxID=3035102 RepID=UPI0024743598|nr:TOMM precursor leader peptide-binding protein [Kitasatospora sp. MAP5-34]MDH6574908.1 ribosomal protein S12 methylthiotransferase accessory factor [Kitasatospora sp. MAP5-34]
MTQRLRDLLATELADSGQPWPVLDLAAALTATTPAVVALDEWTPDQADALSAHAWRTGATLLPVRLDGSTALIGPLLHPDAPACLGCVETERLATIGGRTPRDQGDLLLGGITAPTVLPLLAALAADALAAALAGPLADPARRPGTVWAVRTEDGTCTTHRSRPRHGGCPLCGPLPEDTAEGARFAPARRPLPDPYRLRQDNPATTLAGLRAALLDPRLGPVANVFCPDKYPIAVASAEVVGHWEEREGGYGRSSTFAEAERIALFEAVERMTGMIPRGKRTVLHGSFAELGPERALDPARLGLFEPDVLELPEFRLARYTPDLSMSWVYGWSMGADRALAVPEQVAYWGLPAASDGGGPARFVLESSNGCGLGNSLEEAVLHGLLEVAERDAFLMAWYARTPLTRVATPDDDPLVGHFVDRLDSLGYDLLLFAADNDFGVPVVASLVLCRDTESPAPQAFFAAGAHPDPREAIRSAAVEAVVNLEHAAEQARARPAKFDRDRLRPMLDQPVLVAGMDDHIGLYTLPEARARFEFLLADRTPPRPWQEVWPGRPQPVPDLGALLTELAARVVRAGMDVVVVDQTDPVVRDSLGLYAAKVVVPGALPMTFGQVYRRTLGLPRLLDVPWRLGRLPARPGYQDLALDPHPFP